MAIVEVVKYNGGPDTFAWKYPSEELGTWTQLIVNESQEAILFKGGQALDLFPSGRHTLETANIPFLNKIVNLPFGGRSPFTAEVWYINKVYSLDVKWGTATPIQLQDPKYKIFVPVRSFGQFGIQIEDSRKFLIKLVGTLSVFDKDSIIKYFRGLYLTKVKDAISSYLVHKQISVLEINAYLDELSEQLKEKMVPILSEYGIKLVNFYVNDINIPEDDNAVIKLKDALAKRAEMDIVGYNYTQERSFDTMEGAATNPSSGQAGFMGAGLGLGMGMGLGNSFANQMGIITQNMTTTITITKTCPNCGTEMEQEKRFCSDCGFDTQKNDSNKKRENVNCSNCGASYSINAKFCPECGDKYNPCHKCGADLKEDATVCPECGSEKPKLCNNCGYKIENENTKFCPECGTSLIQKCSSCGTEINGSPKFCPECGNKF
ncbi:MULTISPECIES: SPFH domain-containing protein [Clostridium]|uniref:SPFH domain-containing protein n=1 Tax=Clostridium TaxID=1485 RepID=UPI000983E3D3|nr:MULTISPECIES: SPFH domain-containing protein [Clostridium]AQR98177.1 double zinc ribbon [Clostridium saccharoperbutylacetonicum]NSB34071.1 membrane protease subunit (stomatin/prohibitin family) [Clostridium saccharoperbutylacetonicum]